MPEAISGLDDRIGGWGINMGMDRLFWGPSRPIDHEPIVLCWELRLLRGLSSDESAAVARRRCDGGAGGSKGAAPMLVAGRPLVSEFAPLGFARA